MPCQLSADCLNEIFEYLEKDQITLYPCLLVNRFWCKIVVRILWKNVWNVEYRRYIIALATTLIACLPNESKDLLYKNGIIIPTWKPPLFNYASFCKVLSIFSVYQMIQYVLEKQIFITSQSLNYNKYLLSQEILKMFMNQISTLETLNYCNTKYVQHIIPFTNFPGATNCLMNLTELDCVSNACSDFFYQISQTCRNIQSFAVSFKEAISDGLADLISLQKNLKKLSFRYEEDGMEDIISSLSKISSTVTKLKIRESYIPLSFVVMFINLQELVLSFYCNEVKFDHLNPLQYATFLQLKVLKLKIFDLLNGNLKFEPLIKFIEINGRNLKELYIGGMVNGDNSLNLAIAKFCPNLKTLFTIFFDGELETLKIILNRCQYLGRIKTWCGVGYLSEEEILDFIAKYSSKNFYELKLYYYDYSEIEIHPENLESFFIHWKKRIPQKPVSLIIIKEEELGKCIIGLEGENVEIIEKYKKLGVIKKFVTRTKFV